MFANKQYAHIFIANLAVLNLLACICTAVTIVSSLNPTVGITEVPCGIIIFGNLPLRPLVLLSLTLLTIKRFYAIVKGNTSVQQETFSVLCVWNRMLVHAGHGICAHHNWNIIKNKSKWDLQSLRNN